jgi:hypothetical protein
LSAYMTDGSDAGQWMHISCDGCNAEVAVPIPDGGIDARGTPDELSGWRRGIGERDLCPSCQPVPLVGRDDANSH